MGAISSIQPAQIGGAPPVLQGTEGNTEGKIGSPPIPVTTQAPGKGLDEDEVSS